MCTKRVLSIGILCLIGSISSLHAQNGPGGVGSTGGSSSLLLWLKADAISGLNDGDSVATWNDLSGRNHHATQSTANLRPTYETDAGNTINGKPVVRFYNDNTTLINSSFSYTGQFTTIAVYRTPSARTSDWSKRVFSAPTSSNADDAGGVALMEYSSGAISPKINLTVNGSGTTARYAIAKKVNPSGSMVDGLNEFDGNIAELIVFNESLSYGKQVLIQNYLGKKYNITPSDNKYASTTHTVDVAGIGRSGTSNDSATAGGMVMKNLGTLASDGQYFIFGHNGTTNQVVTTDLPAGVDSCWSRNWYIDQTGWLGGNSIAVGFDFSDAGISGTPTSAGDYVLLARSGTSGTYSIISTGSTSVVGDRIMFTLSDVNITDRYYTLGILSPSGSNSGGNISLVGPGGFSPNNGSASIILWLRADAVTGVSNGGVVGTWYDQSGYNHHATQNILSLRPTYQNDAGNTINGKPVLRFYNDNTYLQNSSFSHSGLFQTFCVWSIPSARTSNGSKRVFSAPSSSQTDQVQGIYVYETSTGTASAKLDVNWQSNSSRSTARYAVGKYVAANGTVTDGAYEFDGNIAEIIVFNETVSYAKRVIIENYLSAKYGVTCSDDKYSETNYKYDVSGIGRSTETIATANSAGMIMTNGSSLFSDGKYFIFGHNGATPATSVSNLPSGVVGRWSREWFIDQTGWLNAGSLTIAFDYGDAGATTVPGSASNYRLLKRTSTSANFSIVPATVSVTGDRVVFTISDDNNITDAYYTLGLLTEDITLPVELHAFGGRVESGRVVLNWSTASEVDNAGFKISRSLNNESNFIPIASYRETPALVGKGTTTNRNDYRFTDADILAPGNRYFYRLESIATDGIISEAATAAVDIPIVSEQDVAFFRLGKNWPNPCISSTTIPFSLPENHPVIFTLRDMQGRELRHEEIDGVQGDNAYEFDARGLAPGTYWYQVRMGNALRQRMLIIL